MFQVECVGPAKTCATKVTQLCEEWHSSSYLSAEPTASTPQLRGVPYVVRPVRALGSKFPIFGTLVIGSDRLPFPRHPLIGRAFLRLVFPTYHTIRRSPRPRCPFVTGKGTDYVILPLLTFVILVRAVMCRDAIRLPCATHSCFGNSYLTTLPCPVLSPFRFHPTTRSRVLPL